MLKRNWIAGQSVRHDAGGEREHIADDAHQHNHEQANNNADGVAAKIRHEAAQILVGRGVP